MRIAAGQVATGDKGPDGNAIRSMFASIAPRYDFINHFLSLSIDRYWRRKVVQLIAREQPVSSDRCLDLCTGTGDLALEIRRRLGIDTYAADFCHPMLVRCNGKTRSDLTLQILEADSQVLPFTDGSFRFVTMAFGLRNIERRRLALEEMYRVLEPGGLVAILEFSQPVVPVLRELFHFYFHYVLPKLGAWISGTQGPYTYLPESVMRFPAQTELARELEVSGWSEVGYRNLSFGIVALHWGRKP